MEWGLGHATRCIPIINELLSTNCEVFIAAAGATGALLKSEFPQAVFLPLPGYGITLSSTRSFFLLKMISQFPAIVYAVCHEKQWLKRAIKQHNIQVVISDNRVGLYTDKIPSIYITHQLLIKTGHRITAAIARRIHLYFIRKFTQCWVLDFEKDSLAGELSHPPFVPANVRYIGALSRFNKTGELQKKYDLAIILSGPEPQRTIFENILLHDLSSYNGTACLVRGLPGNTNSITSVNPSLEIINHLPGESLGKLIQQAVVVISRSGYTTVMDMVKLAQKAILVPTPGQGEQEYLAGYLKEKNLFFSTPQHRFNLARALEDFQNFKFSLPVFEMEQYKLVVQNLLTCKRVTCIIK